MAELPDLIAAAQQEMRRRLSGITPEAWDLPTPCTEWTVDGLVCHLVFAEAMVKPMLAGAPAEAIEAVDAEAHRVPRDELRAVWEQAVVESLDALRAPAALDGMVVHRVSGEMPALQLAVFRLIDNVVHSWDLAAALGADRTVDDGLVAEALAFVEPFRELIPRTVFAEEVATDGGDQQSRLLAILGRDPSWSSGES